MIIFTMGALLLMIVPVVLFALRSKLIWDQILAFNIITNIIVMLMLLFTTEMMDETFIDTALVFTLLSFIGSLFLITFIYKRGDL